MDLRKLLILKTPFARSMVPVAAGEVAAKQRVGSFPLGESKGCG